MTHAARQNRASFKLAMDSESLRLGQGTGELRFQVGNGFKPDRAVHIAGRRVRPGPGVTRGLAVELRVDLKVSLEIYALQLPWPETRSHRGGTQAGTVVVSPRRSRTQAGNNVARTATTAVGAASRWPGSKLDSVTAPCLSP